MNYLAHLYLTDGSPEAFLGSILPDILRGATNTGFPEKVQRYMRLHVAVDRYCAGHPAFRRSQARVQPGLARYSGVLVDVFYDHVLARDWDRYAVLPLPDFATQVYRAPAQLDLELPSHVRAVLRRMATADWLPGYADPDGVHEALRRLARRSRRGARLDLAIADLETHVDALREDFAAFLPDLRAFAEAEAGEPLARWP